MNAVALGPLVIAGDRLAALLGIAAFLAASSLVARFVDRGLDRWANHALILGLIGARAGHVAAHLDAFLAEPWRVLAIWQGGFAPLWGFAAALAVTAWHARTPRKGLAAAVALGAGALAWAGAQQLAPDPAGTPPPAQAFERLDGPALALADTGGRPAVVNLWASWCPPCRREMPMLAEMAASRPDVAFLFVNQGEDATAVRAYLGRSGLALAPVLLDHGMAVPGHYGSKGLPVTLFLGPDGRLVEAHAGEISREVLIEAIERLRR